MDRQHGTVDIDLLGLVVYFKKRLWLIALVTVIFAFGGYVKSAFLTTPMYTASTQMYVLNRTYDDRVVSADFQISNYMLYDYQGLIAGPNVAKEVIQKLDLKGFTPASLASRISVSALENTRILQIFVTDSNPQRAAEIANAVREEAAIQIKDIMEVDAVKLVYAAEVPKSPSSPNVTSDTLVAGVIGLIAILGILAVIFFLDDTIRTEEDVEKWLGLSVLGVIPSSAELNIATPTKRPQSGKPAQQPAGTNTNLR